jgi:hypothetical protein
MGELIRSSDWASTPLMDSIYRGCEKHCIQECKEINRKRDLLHADDTIPDGKY